MIFDCMELQQFIRMAGKKGAESALSSFYEGSVSVRGAKQQYPFLNSR